MELKKLFKPTSICVIGISKRNPLSPGRIILLKNEYEMNVKVYGIHPEGGDLEGVKLHTRLDALPEIPDMLVIAVGADDRAAHPPGGASAGAGPGGVAWVGGAGHEKEPATHRAR